MKKRRFGNDSATRMQKASPTTETPDQEVTHGELEAAGQQRLRFRPFSVEEEGSAAEWWARRLMQAEASTGNATASKSPDKYMQAVKSRIAQNEDVLFGVVEEWRKAKATFTLDEPIWGKAEATRPRTLVARQRAAAVGFVA